MTAKWGEITAGAILSPTQGELISGSAGTRLGGLSTDSREITRGQLFWALKGDKYDGHDFLIEALDKGAVGLVIEKAYRPQICAPTGPLVISVPDTLMALGDLARWWRHQHPIPVVAVTGSVGKTTTKEMAATILGLGATTLKNKGNLNNLIGLPLTLLTLEEAHQKAVLEMGMNRPGEIARLTRIADPDVGLITNVTSAHLEGTGDINAVARAKAELLEEMSRDGRVLLNGDDELLMSVASPLCREAITYGLGSGNDIRAEKISNLGKEGVAFDLLYLGRSNPVRLRVPGLQNVYNALAASAIAFCLKTRFELIVEGLNRFRGIKGRFMITTLPAGVSLVDDTYNSNPASLKAAIETVKHLVRDGGRVIVGLGDMLELGQETGPAHLEAGGLVAELGAVYFFAMGEHGREMIEGALDWGYPSERAFLVNSHEEMVRKIANVMRDGDVVLLKASRKMRLERVVEGLVEAGSSQGWTSQIESRKPEGSG